MMKFSLCLAVIAALMGAGGLAEAIGWCVASLLVLYTVLAVLEARAMKHQQWLG